MNQWISVKERLPNKRDIVIALCQQPLYGDEAFIAIYYGKIKDGQGKIENHFESDYGKLRNIEYWFPLPEKPK